MKVRSNSTDSALSRRSFLARGLACAGAAAVIPGAGFAAARSSARGWNGKRLVVVQLSGGNDSLSCLVPHGDDAYHRLRKTTRIKATDVHDIDGYVGLNPRLEGLFSAWNEGKLSIIQGIGYADSPRSHFRSFDIWHTARAEGRASGEGWLARAAATWKGTSPDAVVHLGREAPYSLMSSTQPPVVLEAPSVFRWLGQDGADRALAAAAGLQCYEQATEATRHTGRDRTLAQLRSVLDDARESSHRIREATLSYTTNVEYPRDTLSARLRDMAALINGGVESRILSTLHTGFDTHSEQRGRYDQLMLGLDMALAAFLQDLGRTEAGRDTTILVFSEFGRRVAENGSKGTDHGKGGVAFVLGHNVKGALHGKHPSLDNLVGGDLGFNVDFRSVYAGLCQDVLGCDAESILGARYPKLELVG